MKLIALILILTAYLVALPLLWAWEKLTNTKI